MKLNGKLVGGGGERADREGRGGEGRRGVQEEEEEDIIGIQRIIQDLSQNSLLSRDGKSKQRKERKLFSKCSFVFSPLFIRYISLKVLVFY